MGNAIIKQSILALEVSSPQELSEVLPEILKEGEGTFCCCSLAIYGPQVLVCPFNMANVPVKEIKNRLKFEAVEALSLPADEIELDYQIFNSTEEVISGVYICAPKSLINGYLTVLDKAKLIPLKITAHILASINSFFQQHPAKEERFCILHFDKKHNITIAVFNNQQCDFLREIPYENLDEAKLEVIQSLRSACAKSSVKKLDHIYYSGDVEQKDQLIAEAGKEFNAKIQNDHSIDIAAALSSDDIFFSLNLIRNYTLSRPERKRIFTVTHVVLTLVLMYCLIQFVRIQQSGKAISELKSSYSTLEFDYAKSLEKQLKSL